MSCTIRPRLVYAAAICAGLLTSGCAQAPTFDIMGSVFPSWLVCLAAGVLLASLTRWLLVRRGIQLLFPLLTYPCLAAIFVFGMWLIFFW